MTLVEEESLVVLVPAFAVVEEVVAVTEAAVVAADVADSVTGTVETVVSSAAA